MSEPNTDYAKPKGFCYDCGAETSGMYCRPCQQERDYERELEDWYNSKFE